MRKHTCTAPPKATVYSRQLGVRKAASMQAAQERAAADDRARVEPMEYQPFHKFKCWASWLKYMRHLLQLIYTTAGYHDAHNPGSDANRYLQSLLKRLLVNPRFIPRKLKPVSDSGPQSPDDAIRTALKLIDKGEVGRAAHILSSEGLAVVNEDTMKQLLALFPGAHMTVTAACDIIEQLGGASAANAEASAAATQSQLDSGASLADDDSAGAAPEAGEAESFSGVDIADSISAAVQQQAASSQAEGLGGAASGPNVPLRSASEPVDGSRFHRDKVKAFLNNRRDKAADALGWNADALLHLAHNVNEREYRALVDVFELINAGAIDDEHLLQLLRLTRGHALNKPKSGVRPAGSVSWWVQVPASIVLAEMKDEIRVRVGPQNVAVGVKGGSEALPWAARLLLEQNNTWVIMSTDCTAAFPSVDREALRKVAATLGLLSGNARLHYGAQGDQSCYKLEFLGVDGRVHTIHVPGGGVTGCAKLPALFCIALQEAIASVRIDHPDVVIMGIMDDNFILGEPLDVLAAYEDMAAALKTLKLDYNATKNAMFVPDHVPITEELNARMIALGIRHKDTLELCYTKGVVISGSPLGTPSFVKADLDKRLAKLDKTAETIESLVVAGSQGAPWQGLLQLVQQCVATINPHLARSLPPDDMREFAANVDSRLATLSLRVAGLLGAASESAQAFDDVEVRRARVLLSSKCGGLGTLCLKRTLEAAFVGAAALIGPVIMGLAPRLNLQAEGRTRSALVAAIEICKAALPAVTAAENAVAADDAPVIQGQQAPDKKKKTGVSLSDLRKLSASTIFDESFPKMQGVLSCFLADRERDRIADVLTQMAALGGEHSHRGWKQLARFLEGCEEHAGAWLHARRDDPECRMQDGHFRIAVAVRLGINPFQGVQPSARCAWCKEEVGDDLLAHDIECVRTMRGDNNRRHQWLQQAICNILKLIGKGMVCLHPLVLAFFGSGAHESGCLNPVSARERVVGSKTESVAQNSRRQGDLGITGVLGTDSIALIDITVSDGGGSKPGPGYQPGIHRQQNAVTKRANYVGANARFTGIQEKQLIVPSWDAMGGETEETEKFLQIVNQSIAAGSSESFGVIVNRTRCRIATALYNSIAFNSLASRGRLLPAARRAGGSGSAGSRSSAASAGHAQGGSSGAAVLAASARAEVVRTALSQEVRRLEAAESVAGGHWQRILCQWQWRRRCSRRPLAAESMGG